MPVQKGPTKIYCNHATQVLRHLSAEGYEAALIKCIGGSEGE